VETEDTKYACTEGEENPDKTQGNQKPGVRGKEGRREEGKEGGRERGRERGRRGGGGGGGGGEGGEGEGG